MEKDMVLQLFKEVDGKLSEIKETGERVEVHVMKTNGRVTKLEKWQMGMVMCGTLFFTIILPLFIYAYKSDQENIKLKILDRNDLSNIVENIINEKYNVK